MSSQEVNNNRSISKHERNRTPFLSVGEIHEMNDVRFINKPKRGSQYQPIVDRMTSLEKGQSFTVEVSKDIPVKVIHNRMNAALKRLDVQPPKGCVFVKRTRVDGNIEIGCVEA